jgi:hypothetical protein
MRGRVVPAFPLELESPHPSRSSHAVNSFDSTRFSWEQTGATAEKFRVDVPCALERSNYSQID